jgi:hypothetical protein
MNMGDEIKAIQSHLEQRRLRLTLISILSSPCISLEQVEQADKLFNEWKQTTVTYSKDNPISNNP